MLCSYLRLSDFICAYLRSLAVALPKLYAWQSTRSLTVLRQWSRWRQPTVGRATSPTALRTRSGWRQPTVGRATSPTALRPRCRWHQPTP